MERTVYGVQPVIELLTAKMPGVRAVFLAHGLDGVIARRIRTLAEADSVPVRQISRSELEERGGSSHHQGVLAVVVDGPSVEFESVLSPAASDLVMVADGVQDPQNLGALLRTTEFMGGKAVVVPKHGACTLTGAVAKASAGASEHLPLIAVTNLVQALQSFKEAGYWCYGLVADSGKSLFEIKFHSPTVLIVGNEAKGIRPLVRRHCDELVTIPRFGRVGSLNVANAAAAVLVEWQHQKHGLVARAEEHRQEKNNV